MRRCSGSFISGSIPSETFACRNSCIPCNIADNWDLSSKRATAIVKIILANAKVKPQQLMAAGRDEFMPIDPQKTTEERQKNVLPKLF